MKAQSKKELVTGLSPVSAFEGRGARQERKEESHPIPAPKAKDEDANESRQYREGEGGEICDVLTPDIYTNTAIQMHCLRLAGTKHRDINALPKAS